jgi:hypothetical protein
MKMRRFAGRFLREQVFRVVLALLVGWECWLAGVEASGGTVS